MPGANTPNLGLIIPTVGGDVGTWGPEVVADLDILDELGQFAPTTFVASGLIVPGTNPWSVIYAQGGAAGIVLTLSAAAAYLGRIITVFKTDATPGAVTLTPFSGVINSPGNAGSYILSGQAQYVTMHSDGTNWNVIGNN